MENINISNLIRELVGYALTEGLIQSEDAVYTRNRRLELFNETGYKPDDACISVRALHLILEDMIGYAVQKCILENDTVATRDLFDTKICGMITPPPSDVIRQFMEKYERSPKEATDWYYASQKLLTI